MKNKINIPFLKFDLPSEEVNLALNQVLKKGIYFNGAYAEAFIRDFSAFIGMPHMVPTANCTDAIELVLRALDGTAEDEVIVPAFTWFSDASMVEWAGLKLIFADISLECFGLTLASIKSVVTKKTKAIILPHLFGQVNPEIIQIAAYCKAHHIVLIEDCAQAHGAEQLGKKAGSFADISVFSFYPTKNLGALGDAGCILIKDATLSENLKLLSNHGQLARDTHISLGKNSRMDELQAAVLVAKLPILDADNKKRRSLAAIYHEKLKHLPLQLPTVDDGHVYHQFVIFSVLRDRLKAFLLSEGIETVIHYPNALSDIKVFASNTSVMPKARKAASQALSLPIFPNHSAEEILFVCDAIDRFFSNSDTRL